MAGSDVYDSYVTAAVRRFQLRHGLPSSGVLDGPTIIAMNVPGARAPAPAGVQPRPHPGPSQGLGDRYVLVNIPAAEIEAVENGRVRSRHTAVVGKVDRPSPILTSRVHEINFNPYWTVPVSIVRRDLIPKMQQDPSYLANQKIHIYKWGDENREYAYTEIDWNTDEATQYMFRQEPGELNSLGTVKINFHNQHQVYLHDTPQKGLFGEGARFHSSGCVRVQNVRELITWLLTPNGWDRGAGGPGHPLRRAAGRPGGRQDADHVRLHHRLGECGRRRPLPRRHLQSRRRRDARLQRHRAVR